MSETKSELEQVFDAYWEMLAPDYDAPEKEVLFHPTRKWRFDRAWVSRKVAVEIDGGIFTQGRHVRGMGYHEQLNKQNAAMQEFWTVLRFDVLHLRDDPYSMVELIKSVLDR